MAWLGWLGVVWSGTARIGAARRGWLGPVKHGSALARSGTAGVGGGARLEQQGNAMLGWVSLGVAGEAKRCLVGHCVTGQGWRSEALLVVLMALRGKAWCSRQG